MKSWKYPESTMNLLDLAIEAHLARMAISDFVFVQIGANNGVDEDPLRKHILRWNLKGILVEPLPDIYEELIQNYKDQAQLHFENAAVAGHDGKISMWRHETHDTLRLKALSKTASLHREIAFKRLNTNPQFGDYLREIVVTSISLSSLFAKYGISRLSLLFIDAEGYDWKIVREALSIGIKPSIIYFEHLNLEQGEKIESRTRLLQNGYQYTEDSKDTLAVRKVIEGS
ncbi:FkbM family methyltransferase [Syntrophobacter fumaroxidans]|nr:FkbM family methyltransferase [Syntrophobacter fumaroxidans]